MVQLTQAEKVVEAVEQGLVAGRWRAGERLSLQALADELGISMTPVREAVNELVAQRLLERRPGIGTRVAELTGQKLSDLWDLREVLEGLGARWLAQRATDAELAALMAEAEVLDQLRVAAFEQNLNAEGGADLDEQPESVAEGEDKFHRHFVERAGNGDLLLAIKPCHFVLLRTMAATLASGLYPEGQYHPHRRVVQSVASGDPELAEKTMREHVRVGKEIVTSYFSTHSLRAEGGEHRS